MKKERGLDGDVQNQISRWSFYSNLKLSFYSNLKIFVIVMTVVAFIDPLRS